MKTKSSSKNQRLIVSTEERLRRDLIIVNNPVLVEGLALAPVIAACVTLRNAMMLSVMIPILHIPTRFFGNLLIGSIPQRLRAPLYSIMACIFYIPGYMALFRLFGVNIANLGIYLPMLVVDSIILSRTDIPQREKIGASLTNGIVTSFGFAFAAITVGAVREILGLGRIWGIEIAKRAPIPIINTAAGGFMIVAILCAVLQYFISLIKRAKYRGAKESQLLSE